MFINVVLTLTITLTSITYVRLIGFFAIMIITFCIKRNFIKSVIFISSIGKNALFVTLQRYYLFHVVSFSHFCAPLSGGVL